MEAAREVAAVAAVSDAAAAAAAAVVDGVEMASTRSDDADDADDAARLSASATSGTARRAVRCKEGDNLLLVRCERDGAQGAKRLHDDDDEGGGDREVEQHAAEARDALALIGSLALDGWMKGVAGR